MDYALYDPTGNITALVTDPVPVSEQPDAASRLMAREPSVEQVGFLSPGEGVSLCLRMAGGEFCGNASLCAAALYADTAGLWGEASLTLRVSGTDAPVAVHLSPAADGARRASVTMPLPERMEEIYLPGLGPVPVVFLPGIAHAILPADTDRALAEASAASWAERLGADALGLMLFDPEASRLDPLVYVPAAGTLVWEGSCASGASALGAWTALRTGSPVRLSLRQPGGVLTVTASPGGPLLLAGTVRRIGQGQIV